VFACREYACTIEDILSRRTRLAFLNKDAAVAAVPRVADIMAEELGWSRAVKKDQISAAYQYLNSYGGRIPSEESLSPRSACFNDIKDLFDACDSDGSGFLDKQEVKDLAARLGRPLDAEELEILFKEINTDKNGRISVEEFSEWWNTSDSEARKQVSEYVRLGGSKPVDIKDINLLG